MVRFNIFVADIETFQNIFETFFVSKNLQKFETFHGLIDGPFQKQIES